MDYYDLGSYRRKITTTSADAQHWFDRGLVWTYAFNHEEAIVCFEEALRHDPGCAMAHWGIAFAVGPNYNKPWETFDTDERRSSIARARVAAAAAAAAEADPVERALIAAVGQRYPEAEVEVFDPWHEAYAEAMRDACRAHPDDLDVISLCAEAVMNRTPWKLWDLRSGQPAAGAGTAEVVGILETAFRDRPDAWDHPGLLHMYIHLMEMSPNPEKALRHGDRLAVLVPDAGHLLHMATHIDVLCGDYQSVVSRNLRAVEADRKYLARAGAENLYTVYRCHNHHFRIYGAMFLGQPRAALEAADELAAGLPDEILRPLADWLEAFMPMKLHVLVRFGRWADILAEPFTADAELHCSTNAMLRYARAVAFANTGRLAEAAAERDAFAAARERVPETRMLFNNTCRDILAVAEAMMLGEIDYKRGDHAAGLAHLRRAVQLDDGLPYDEPWGWMQPTRHALGALLLEQGQLEEAEAVYRADLGLDATLARACQHPRNVWSLHGLHECLSRRGERQELPHIRLQLDQALARAAVPIRASCFCSRRAAA